MTMRYHVVAAALLLAAIALPAAAQQAKVEQAWARATAVSARAGGVFLTLRETGTADRLVSASSEIAARTELHRTVEDNGIMRMLPVEGIDLAAGETVTFKPGGLHIMLIDLKRPLKQGETFEVTLRFAKGPPVVAKAIVGPPGGSAPPGPVHTTP